MWETSYESVANTKKIRRPWKATRRRRRRRSTTIFSGFRLFLDAEEKEQSLDQYETRSKLTQNLIISFFLSFFLSTWLFDDSWWMDFPVGTPSCDLDCQGRRLRLGCCCLLLHVSPTFVVARFKAERNTCILGFLQLVELVESRVCGPNAISILNFSVAVAAYVWTNGRLSQFLNREEKISLSWRRRHSQIANSGEKESRRCHDDQKIIDPPPRTITHRPPKFGSSWREYEDPCL